jgi:hypothetical protein
LQRCLPPEHPAAAPALSLLLAALEITLGTSRTARPPPLAARMMGNALGGLEVKVYKMDAAEYEESLRPRPPHRCADRMEDLVLVMTGGWGQLRQNLPAGWHLLQECLRSEEG